MIEPSLREKKRYIVFETMKEQTYDKIKSKLYKESLAFLGEKGTGELGLIFLPEHWSGQRGVVRVNHQKVNEFKVILGLIKNLKAKTIKTTGSLKKAKSYMRKK